MEDSKDYRWAGLAARVQHRSTRTQWTKILATLLALVPCYIRAETYLCVAEAGAVVEDGGKAGIAAHLANVQQQKYILTNDSGTWAVKELGTDYALFDNCSSPYYCDRAEGYAGAFFRNKSSGVFSITWMTKNNGADLLLVAKGRCSKL